MAEFAMAIITMFVQLLKGVIFMLTLGPRTLDALSRRVWSKAERIDSGSYKESHSVQLAFDTHGNAMAVSNEYNTVWARYFTPATGWGKAEIIDNSRTPGKNIEDVRGGKNDLRISFDTRGNALAVWNRDTGYDETKGFMQETWDNHYTAGVGWGQAEHFDHSPGETRPVMIARDTQGNALAVWTHFANNSSTLWAKNYKPDTGWSDATPIASVGGDATIMQLASDTNGNAIVLWRTDKKGKNTHGLYSVYVIYYAAAIGWGETMIISKVLNSYHMQTLKFDFDNSGNVILVWSFEDNTDDEKQIHIWAKRYGVATGWEKAVKIDPGVISRYSNHVSESVQAKIAFDSRDNAIVVWTQVKDCSQGGIWTNRYTPGKGWGTAAPITKTDLDQSNHQLAVDPRGNAMVIWKQRNGIGASYYTADAGWSTPEHLYHYSGDGYESLDPKIVFDTEGNAIAIWWHQVFLYTTIWSRQYTPGKGWGKITPVKRDYTNKANYPLMYLAPHDIAHVVWSQRDLDSSHTHYWSSHLPAGSNQRKPLRKNNICI
jgi:hypothetical protein